MSRWTHIYRTIFICFLVCFFSVQVQAAFEDIEIRVLPESVVYNNQYSLGDIAELDGFDIDAIKKLAQIKIGTSPIPGRSLVLSTRYLKSKIRQKFRDVKINIKVPQKAIVSRASIKISKDQIKKIILAEVKDKYSKYEEIEITLKTTLKDIYIPKGKASYTMKMLGKKEQIGGYNSWMLSFNLNQKEVKKLLIRVKVDVFDNVYVAKSKITKGKLIQKTDLKVIKKDISRERKNFKTVPDLIVGKQARRDIFTNESIKQNLVQRPIILDKGTPVKVVYKTKNLHLTNIAKAMKSGRKGDVIPVRTLKSNSTIYAMIVDSKHVEVIL